MYTLDTNDLVFEEIVGGKPDSYIKLKEVDQNATGDFYAIAYYDNGRFRLRTFDENQRSDQNEIEAAELDINTLLWIDEKTMVIDNFPDPFITCCFVNNQQIFVNLHYTYTCTHYSFVYNHVTKETVS